LRLLNAKKINVPPSKKSRGPLGRSRRQNLLRTVYRMPIDSGGARRLGLGASWTPIFGRLEIVLVFHAPEYRLPSLCVSKSLAAWDNSAQFCLTQKGQHVPDCTSG
jgi:hypothetical protein